MAHDPSSPSKLLAPESHTSNFANLSCILVPDLSGTRNLDRIEHVLLLPSFWCEILVPVTWMENTGRVPYGKSYFLSPSSGWQLSICQLNNQHLQSTRHCHIRTQECQINAATLSRPQDCIETHWGLTRVCVQPLAFNNMNWSDMCGCAKSQVTDLLDLVLFLDDLIRHITLDLLPFLHQWRHILLLHRQTAGHQALYTDTWAQWLLNTFGKRSTLVCRHCVKEPKMRQWKSEQLPTQIVPSHTECLLTQHCSDNLSFTLLYRCWTQLHPWSSSWWYSFTHNDKKLLCLVPPTETDAAHRWTARITHNK